MNIQKLKGILPDVVLGQIPGVMDKFSINTPLRLSHFISQCQHESMNFKAIRENLNYSATALRSTFRKYFPTEALANEYARKPEKIANFVYANRMGNGPETSGDGWLYRGRGYIQLTGKVNYAAFSKSVTVDNVIKDPDLVATKYPLLSAGWYWNSRNINRSADLGSDRATITAVTKLINGGTHGLEDRIKHFNKIYAILQSD